MQRSRAGFSITEVIIMITVISIIALIVTFAWGGVRTWSQNKTRENEMNQWMSSFDLFKSKYAYFPGTPPLPATVPASTTHYGPYCLGTFASTGNKCGDYTGVGYNATGGSPGGVATTAILADLAKVGNAPTNNSGPIREKYIGPFVSYSIVPVGTQVQVNTYIYGLMDATPSTGSCPSGTAYLAASPYGDANTTTCFIARNFMYTP